MENELKNTIIDVIPLTRLPLSRQQSFSYLYHEKIPFGTLVSIPLFRRNVNGIAIDNRDDFFHFGNIKLRKINEILDEDLLTEKQMELAKFISEYYLCPLGIVLKFFVVKKTKSRSVERETHSVERKKIILNKEQRTAVNNILKSNESLLVSGNKKIEIYLELVSKTLKSSKQALILLPEIPLLYGALDIIKKYFDEKIIALFHSQLKGSELYNNFQKIKSGEAKIIIGTRQAVFAPFRDLGMIIIDEEQDISYKQWDMNPRYNARTATEELARLYNAKLVLSSSAPSVESYNKFKSSKLKVKSYTENKIDIVDMRKEGWINNSKKRNNDIIFSKKLISEIGFAIKYGRQTFLFVNRRGMSSFSICTNCKEVLRCPRCERALVYNNKGIYRCLHCAYKTDIFPTCPKCQGTSFKNIGIGNQTVEKEINKLFPGAKTKIIDFESLKNKGGQKNILGEINQEKFDVIIGTQTVLKSWDLPHLGLIAIINADDLLSSSDFNSDERAFQVLLKSSEKAGATGGKLIIQTYNPENPVIKSTLKENSENFYDEELEKRKSLKYPPFYRIIKLILRIKNKNNIEKEARIVFEKIKNISEKNKDILIFEPFAPLLSKVRDSYRKQIIIKIKGNNIAPDLRKYLKTLGSDWIIDVDPITIT
jgi:primosomal protein N' (replication factor Y)